MFALLALYLSTHSERFRSAWLAVASLCLGLAVASRPTFLFATPTLLLPLFLWWREGSPKRGIANLPVRGLAAAVLPLAAIGALMAAYNYMRFGAFGEFGTNYQVAYAYYLTKMRLFSVVYIPFNFFLYYLSAPAFSWHFPYLVLTNDHHFPVRPPSDYFGPDSVVGLLVCFPICWMAALSIFSGTDETGRKRTALMAWLLCAWGVFAASALVLLVFHAGIIRYMFDFAPALMLCTSVGLLVLERWLCRRRAAAVRVLGRILWIGALAVSLFASLMFSFEVDGTFRAVDPAGHARVAQFFSRLSFWNKRLPSDSAGPVEIALRFDHPATGQTEPILACGWGEKSERVYLRRTDDDHVVVGHRVGLLGEDQLSRPIPVRDGKVYRLYLDLGSFYSRQKEQAGGSETLQAADIESIDKLKRRWEVLFDGDTVIQGQYGNRAEAPFADPAFLGFDPNSDLLGLELAARIISVRRLTIAEAIAKSANRCSMGLDFLPPRDRAKGSAPILATDGLGTDLCAEIEYMGPDRADLRLIAGGRDLAHSKVFPNSGEWHRLTLSQSFDLPGSPLHVQFDEAMLTAISGDRLDLRRAGLRPGWEQANAPQFTGFMRSVYSDSRTATKFAPVSDRVVLTVKFPRQRKGINEPLLVTGRTGQGDFYEVGYLDDDHIRISLDHWGSAELNSRPIEVDYGAPHRIVFKFTGVNPYAAQSGSIEHGPMQVEIDGQKAWEGDFPRYSFTAEEIHFGRNDLGGTTCAAEFTGELISQEMPQLQ